MVSTGTGRKYFMNCIEKITTYILEWITLSQNILVSVYLFFQDLVLSAISGAEGHSIEEKKRMVRAELIGWQVDQYADNVYLCKIPYQRIDAKDKELRKKYGIE